MGKASKGRTAATILIMIILAIVILFGYYYWSNRTKPIDTSGNNLSEAQQLINKDFITYYPETPKEVTKVFANMMKVLYSNPEEEDIKPLALKIRELYDEEFLEQTPEDSYLNNIYVDLANWKEKNRTITNYLLIKEDEEVEEVVDGVKYVTKFISYTIHENKKFTETWEVLLRQDENKRWKILGWKFLPMEK